MQRAVLSAPVAKLPEPVAAGPANYTVDAARSQVEVVAGDWITGSHVLLFPDHRGRVTCDQGCEKGTVHLEVEIASMRSDSREVEDVIANDLLEAPKFPDAALDGRFVPGSDDERVVDGELRMHGVTKGIHFTATLRPEGSGQRFTTKFVIDRHEFNVHAPKFDGAIHDDFKVRLDLVAVP